MTAIEQIEKIAALEVMKIKASIEKKNKEIEIRKLDNKSRLAVEVSNLTHDKESYLKLFIMILEVKGELKL